MNDKKFIIIIAVLTLVILFGGITLVGNSTSTSKVSISTNAKAEVQDPTSFDFGMSGVSDWVGELAPGKEAKLTAIFDPAFHGPQGTGPVTRFVSVETNDKGNAKITFTLTGTVIR